ncbi:hypothetical protein N665_0767s0004 [Sinapis alba]|nr:hypothetical protein N665_0767s0004 [Sinapis alba]
MVTKKSKEKGKGKDKGKGKEKAKSITRQSVRVRKLIVEGPSNEIPVPEPTVHSLSVGSERVEGSESDEIFASFQERQPMQPLEMYFDNSQFTKICKIQTKCYVTETVKVIRKLKPEMLLLRTIRIEEEDIAWFGVNGVPIRYSMREHALIYGLDCHEYPSRHLKLGSYKFVDAYFNNGEKITIEDVKHKLLAMKPCSDRLKMGILFFLGRIIRGKPKDSGPLDQFILRVVDKLDVCKTFPWGRLTFEDAIKGIKHMMNLLKGEPHPTTTFAGFIIPLEVLAFECIPSLTKEFRVPVDGCLEECPRMCKSRFKKTSMKGYPLEDIYDALGDTKVIHNMLLPTVNEEIMLACIINVEEEYDREGSQSDSWNYWLNVKRKTLSWEEMYELDIEARKFSKKKDKGKGKNVEALSSKTDLESGFDGLKKNVETKLESLDRRLSGMEKTQRYLKRKAKKLERRFALVN